MRGITLAFLSIGFSLSGVSCDEPESHFARLRARVVGFHTEVPSLDQEVVKEALSNLKANAAKYKDGCNTDGDWLPDINYAGSPVQWAEAHCLRIFVMMQAYLTPDVPNGELQRDSGLLSAAERALQRFTQRVPYEPSLDLREHKYDWFSWLIGIPQKLGRALLLLNEVLDPNHRKYFDRALHTMGYIIEPDHYIMGIDKDGNPVPIRPTGQNVVWVATNHLYYALAAGNDGGIGEARIDRVKEMMNGVVSVSNVLADPQHLDFEKVEGIKPDWSFWQHGAQLYLGGYGAGFAQDVALYALLVSGTSWEMPESKLGVLAQYILKGVQWTLLDNYHDLSAIGRQYTRKGNMASGALNALLVLSQLQTSTTDPKLSESRKTQAQTAATKMIGTWQEAGNKFSFEMSRFVQPVLDLNRTGALPTGHRHYPYSDYTIHRTKNAYVSLKMLSERTKAAEMPGNLLNPDGSVGDAEGKKSWHLSDGMLYVVQNGDEYYKNNVIPTLDFTRLPGTTVEQRYRKEGEGYVGMPNGYGKKAFVGGAQLGSYGVSAMDFQALDAPSPAANQPPDPPLTAKKSWFFFNGEVVCLGTNITCPTDNRSETSVTQWPLDPKEPAPLIVDGVERPGRLYFMPATWANCDGIGYYFPKGAKINSYHGPQSGKWIDIGNDEDIDPATNLSREYGNNMLTLWFDHGMKALNQKYAYAVLPGKSAADMESYAAVPPFTILRHEDSIHSVRYKPVNAPDTTVTGTVYWHGGTFGSVTVDNPCIVMRKDSGSNVTLAITEPTQKLQALQVTIAERLTRVLPVVPVLNDPITVSNLTSSSTTITVQTKRGWTYTVELKH